MRVFHSNSPSSLRIPFGGTAVLCEIQTDPKLSQVINSSRIKSKLVEKHFFSLAGKFQSKQT